MNGSSLNKEEDMSKRNEPVHSEALLSPEGPTITFITDNKQTIAICPEVGYDKRVAWHSQGKMTNEKRHESVKHLFDQYIEDAKRCLCSTPTSTF